MMNVHARLWILAVVLTGLALSGCVEAQLVGHAAKQATRGSGQVGAYKIGDPYQVNGVWYYPRADFNYQQTGIASWYGPGFHGKYTANGERYDQNALTAAHRTLPMPSMVRVTNLENGRSIKVRINDRGPFKNARIIDLSRRAADLLGFRKRGTAKVRVEILETESRQFAAAALSSEAAKTAPQPVPRVPVTVEFLPSNSTANGLTPTVSQTVAALPRNPSGTSPREIAVPMPDGLVTTVPVRSSKIFVQAGSFAHLTNAHKLRTRLLRIGRAQIAQIMIDRKRFYRVRFGPMRSVEDADKLLAVLIDKGHTGARVVVD